jgi:toxin FitB
MFILDTNVLSELRKAALGKANLNVTRWASGVEAKALYLSAITIHELELGILRLRPRKPHTARSCANGWTPTYSKRSTAA